MSTSNPAVNPATANASNSISLGLRWTVEPPTRGSRTSDSSAAVVQIALRAELERLDALDETTRYLERNSWPRSDNRAHDSSRKPTPSHDASGTDHSTVSPEHARSPQRRTLAPRSTHDDVGLAHPRIDGTRVVATTRSHDGARRVTARRLRPRCQHPPLPEDVHHRIDLLKRPVPPACLRRFPRPRTPGAADFSGSCRRVDGRRPLVRVGDHRRTGRPVSWR
jgi:hypothetical protein